LMRTAGDRPQRARRVFGWIAVALAVTGIFHVAALAGETGDGAVAYWKHAGGALGFLIGQPLFAGLTAAPAIIVLALLGGFGILLLTGTQLRDLPGLLARAVRSLAPRPLDDDAADD